MHGHRISPLQQRMVEAMAVRNMLGRRATNRRGIAIRTSA
jgi:hypothetical protein